MLQIVCKTAYILNINATLDFKTKIYVFLSEYIPRKTLAAAAPLNVVLELPVGCSMFKTKEIITNTFCLNLGVTDQILIYIIYIVYLPRILTNFNSCK